jgi:hypothetical protein
MDCNPARYADVPHARRQDPGTSHRAGRHVEAHEGTTSQMRPNTLKHSALSLIDERPQTANEVGRRMARGGVWKRVSDLKNAKLIEKVGEKEDALSEQDNIIWGCTEFGRSVLAILDRGEAAQL